MLTEADRLLLLAVLRDQGGFNLFTEWYFGGIPLPKQYAFHQALQPNVIWIGSIASGKTWGIAASMMADCMSLPGFKALSTSITSAQAEIPFEMVTSWITDEHNEDRLSHLVDEECIVKRPFPLIRFKNGSTWLFRTAGTQAIHLRGLEFDRIDFDEGGYEYDEITLRTLRGRLRGERLPNVPRMSRLDITTSPTDAPWLRAWFDKGSPEGLEPQLHDYISLRSTIYDNTHVTPEQIRLMKEGYSDEMIRIELLGEFPEYGNTMFPQSAVFNFEDRAENDLMEDAIRPETGPEKPGYREEVHPRHGIVRWEVPPKDGHIYIMAGDPGTGDVPNRNAGCVMVFDATSKPYRMVFFDWVSGRGSYMPFLNTYKYAMHRYYPVHKGIDATGPQKALDELAFTNLGIETNRIAFNRDKDTGLNALSLLLTNQEMVAPFIKGLHIQLSKYHRKDDGLEQDLVMTLAMIAFLLRFADTSPLKAKSSTLMRRPRTMRSSYGRHPVAKP